MTVNFTSEYIKALLSKEEYSPIERKDKNLYTADERKEVNEIEAIVSFGEDSINLFDTLIHQLGTLPTQREYVRKGLVHMYAWIEENRPDIELTVIKREACLQRLTRTYMSKVIELHLECTIKEYLPELNVKTYSLIDSVMGVDLIAEDDKKRYYVHVTSNTPFAQGMLEQKENRGGYRVGNTYVQYSRDFSGDLILRYDTHKESDTTDIVNGFPLFNVGYVVWRFRLARETARVGEDINAPYSKLQHFKDWAKTYLSEDIDSI